VTDAADRTVTIAGAAGAWGASARSTPQLLADGRADYIVYEGLAEITMAILTRQLLEDPARGYARDLIETVAANLAAFRERGTRVVTNAGGMNPAGAAAVIRAAAERADLDVRVATVTGDDLRPRLDELREAGHDIAPATVSMNAYLGARPIAAALDAGADVVVTGRVVDSALVLGPLVHEFGWGRDDLDLLSAGSLAGHLLECGPQSVGGLLTDWEDTASWAEPGYPLAEVRSDGSFVVTAPEDSDALVDVRTVTEQLLYEIGDPAAYVLPDVVCDWTGVTVTEVGDGRVEVRGARGRPPTPTLKAPAQVVDGWRVLSLLMIGGRDAAAKAERAARDLLTRGRRMLAERGLEDFRAVDVEVLGAEATYGPHARRDDTREVVLKLAVHHDDRDALIAFVREVPSIGLAGAPGITGGGAGLPRVTPLVRLDGHLVDRALVPATVALDGEPVAVTDVDPGACRPLPEPATPAPSPAPPSDDDDVVLPLIAVAHGRSGDKGADVNIGIRARHPDLVDLVRSQVTAEAVADHLAHLGADRVERFDLPGVDAVNLLLHGGLGAGGTASLRYDPQGKAVAQQLLDLPVRVPRRLLDHPALRAVAEVVAARRPEDQL
jgi:hypothetical protein